MIKMVSDANNGMQSIGELWESIAKLSAHIVEDNKKYGGKYPMSIRRSQLATVKALVKELDSHSMKRG